MLKKDNKDDQLYLIIGADNLINLDKWKNIEEILTYNIDIDKYMINYNKDNFILLRDFKPLDVSSTEIRNGNLEKLDKKVKDYIIDNNLYGGLL